MYLKTETGTVKDIKGIEEAEAILGVKQVSIVHGVGELVGEIKSSVDRAGFVIAQAEDVQKAVANCAVALDKISIVTK